MSAPWNPRYVLYAQAHGRSPEAMRAHDRDVAWPAAPACGFILWLSRSWEDWRRQRGLRHDTILDNAAHADFDEWLASRVNGATTTNEEAGG